MCLHLIYIEKEISGYECPNYLPPWSDQPLDIMHKYMKLCIKLLSTTLVGIRREIFFFFLNIVDMKINYIAVLCISLSFVIPRGLYLLIHRAAWTDLLRQSRARFCQQYQDMTLFFQLLYWSRGICLSKPYVFLLDSQSCYFLVL